MWTRWDFYMIFHNKFRASWGSATFRRDLPLHLLNPYHASPPLPNPPPRSRLRFLFFVSGVMSICLSVDPPVDSFSLAYYQLMLASSALPLLNV